MNSRYQMISSCHCSRRLHGQRALRSILIIAGFVASPFAAAQPVGVKGYEVTPIGILDGHTQSSASGLDNLGRIVGRSGSAPSTPMVWVNGILYQVPDPPGYENSKLADIGSGGTITGSAGPIEPGLTHPFVWVIGEGIIALPLIPGDNGGYAVTVDDAPWPQTKIGGERPLTASRATIWTGLEIDVIGEPYSSIPSFNIFGDACGWQRNEFRVERPVIWTADGQLIDIGDPDPMVKGTAGDITDRREVAGTIDGPGDYYYWFDGKRTFLKGRYICEWGVSAGGMNNNALIAGMAPRADCEMGLAVWEPVGYHQFVCHIVDEHLYVGSPEVTFTSVRDINDAGQMSAQAEFSGVVMGALVTPYAFEMRGPLPGRAGETNAFEITGLAPDQRITLVWGTAQGAQPIRRDCIGGKLLIQDPRILGSRRADADGIARFFIHVPPAARGRTFRFQAIAAEECDISHTVEHVFE